MTAVVIGNWKVSGKIDSQSEYLGLDYLPIKNHWDNFIEGEKWEMGKSWHFETLQLIRLSLFGHKR